MAGQRARKKRGSTRNEEKIKDGTRLLWKVNQEKGRENKAPQPQP